MPRKERKAAASSASVLQSKKLSKQQKIKEGRKGGSGAGIAKGTSGRAKPQTTSIMSKGNKKAQQVKGSTKNKTTGRKSPTCVDKKVKAKAKANEKRPSSVKQSTSAVSHKSTSVAAGVSSNIVFLAQFLTDNSWKALLNMEFQKQYFLSLDAQLAKEYADNTLQIFPPKHLIFNAFNITPFKNVKVVLLGQDPYHDDGQAHGLAFSVSMGIPPPPSLKNMYKELSSDIAGFAAPSHGCLEQWARNGVLLLNATLTVRAHQPNSHAKLGWRTFTDAAISALSQHHSGCVFLLWGNEAHRKQSLIDTTKHRVICTAHPSPLSFTKFSGCRCFSKVNKELQSLGVGPVNWSLQ